MYISLWIYVYTYKHVGQNWERHPVYKKSAGLLGISRFQVRNIVSGDPAAQIASI